MVYIHYRETCSSFAIKLCADSLSSEDAPLNDGPVVFLWVQQ